MSLIVFFNYIFVSNLSFVVLTKTKTINAAKEMRDDHILVMMTKMIGEATRTERKKNVSS